MLVTICLVALSLRGIAPDWFSIVLGNAVALGAAVLFLQGIFRSRGLKIYWWPECLAAALGICAVIYFRYFTNNLNTRTVVMSGVLGTFGLLAGFTLLRREPSGRRLGMVLTGIVFILAATANFARMYFYTVIPASDFLAPSAANAAFFALTGLGICSWSFGFLLMTDERIALELIVAPPGTSDVAVDGSPQLPMNLKTVPEAEVRQQLQRIVESDVFRRSARMERFLRVTAERALNGHPESVKEYTLGRDVFDRGENYDPRTDSIVRVEAQRLRRKLREYYENHGSDDPILIEFQRGSYVPHFRYKELHQTKGAS
jgi:hypothetical protein